MLLLEPSGTDSEDESSRTHVIECHRHLGREARVAEAVAVDEAADPRLRCALAKCRERGPPLEVGARRLAENCVEMVSGPERVVAGAIGRLPQTLEVRPFVALLAGGDPKRIG